MPDFQVERVNFIFFFKTVESKTLNFHGYCFPDLWCYYAKPCQACYWLGKRASACTFDHLIVLLPSLCLGVCSLYIRLSKHWCLCLSFSCYCLCRGHSSGIETSIKVIPNFCGGTKNRDLWEGLIFWTCAEYNDARLILRRKPNGATTW